ncbi:MAG: hypothetical protein WBO45_16905 [Planctomycetota bacterium]
MPLHAECHQFVAGAKPGCRGGRAGGHCGDARLPFAVEREADLRGVREHVRVVAAPGLSVEGVVEGRVVDGVAVHAVDAVAAGGLLRQPRQLDRRLRRALLRRRR